MVGRAEVQILDDVLWIKHIRNDEALKDWLAAAPAGILVELEIDGWRASWRKMADGPDGRPTPGFKPFSYARAQWEKLRRQRGRWASIKLCDDA